MEHCDPDSLTLSALGEPALDATDVEHVMACEHCRAELRTSRRTVDLARGPEPVVDQTVEPPPEVWDRIRSELDLAGARPSSEPASTAPTTDETATGVPARRGRGRQLFAVAAGAVVLALAAGAAGAALAGRGDPGTTDRLVAETTLDPLPDGAGAEGTARLVDDDDGRRLQVDVAGLAETGGYYEVWLIDPATESMVSLGVLESSGPADLRVPAGVDISDYSLVDVSDEPLDGDPTHSRVSVTRGQLPPAEG